jgi:hypothetical protein
MPDSKVMSCVARQPDPTEHLTGRLAPLAGIVSSWRAGTRRARLRSGNKIGRPIRINRRAAGSGSIAQRT